jgi:hypothetical protein
MKSIFKHSDYRVFLREAFESRKNRTSGYTYKQFATDLGFDTPSLLQLILLKKRNLQLHQVHQICRRLAFNQTEHEFFESLVHENQTSIELDKSFYAQKCKELLRSSSASKVDFVIQEDGDLLGHPSVVSILLALHGEKKDLSEVEMIQRLSQKTGLGTEVIEQWLPRALRQTCLTHDQAIYVVDFDVAYVRRENIPTKQHRKAIHKENLIKALEVLEHRHGEDGVKFLSHTFTFDKKDFCNLYDTIKDLPLKLSNHSEGLESNQMAQLNIQFFTLGQN